MCLFCLCLSPLITTTQASNSHFHNDMISCDMHYSSDRQQQTQCCINVDVDIYKFLYEELLHKHYSKSLADYTG